MSTPSNSAVGRQIGLRSTRQREAIVALLTGSPAFRSAQDLYASLRQDGASIGLTTVYRTLQAMSETGDVDVLHAAGGEALFRLCSDRHHHHLVCRECGFTVEIDGPGIEQWAAQTASSNGFTQVTHEVELSGLCKNCAV